MDIDPDIDNILFSPLEDFKDKALINLYISKDPFHYIWEAIDDIRNDDPKIKSVWIFNDGWLKIESIDMLPDLNHEK